MILLIDNYDSFAHNLARYFQRLGCEVQCERNDAIDVEAIRALKPQLIVLSPGPCTPDEAGCCLDVVRELGDQFPILGVCLGHQAIAQGLGGQVVRATEPIHGMSSQVRHDGKVEFQGLPNPFNAGRYHSLVVQTTDLPECLEVSATVSSRTAVSNEAPKGNETTARNEVVMALRHRTLPIFGWQFHPESILTECGYELLTNLLQAVGIEVPRQTPTIESERIITVIEPDPYPTRPITF